MEAHANSSPLETGSALAWERLTPAARFALLALFFVSYALLVAAGYELKESLYSLTIIWPAAGLLLAVLFLVPLRLWIWFVPLQFAAELLVGFFNQRGQIFAWDAFFPCANFIDGAVGALVAKRLIGDRPHPRIRHVVEFIGAAAIGAAAGAVAGAFGATRVLPDASYLNQWQVWWAGNWLGSVVIAPAVVTWVMRWRIPAEAVLPARLGECALFVVISCSLTVWIFFAAPGSPTSLLDLPFVLLALLVLVSFRLPPRWAVTFSALTILLAATAASRGLGPFAADPSPFGRLVALQTYLATLAVVTFMLTTVLAEKKRVFDALVLSDERYRNLVERSTEAVWRIELDQPMPTSLPIAEQLAWLREHAFIAECNREFRGLHTRQGIVSGDLERLRGDVPWSAIYFEHLEDAARREYSVDALRFSLRSGSEREHWLASFSGVVGNGRLVRIWGVARNVTELVKLTERLKREQERLQAYARQLTGAEERARRTTAIDLHDGIGQLLAGLGMSLDAAVSQLQPGARAHLEEMRATVRDIQETTRRVIADLSPPGLYELGLGPALQWLSIYLRNNSGLQVELAMDLDERSLDLDTRVLVFKVVRELLRNVVKHARVNSARVSVAAHDARLIVEVRDQGVGFDWQLDLFRESTFPGFGLWSIADRVRTAEGDFAIDTAPGKGCNVKLVFPLRSGGFGQQAARAG
ncbi:MAG: MASE1 domain-containing protein [Steroidobacterales bacterium]